NRFLSIVLMPPVTPNLVILSNASIHARFIHDLAMELNDVMVGVIRQSQIMINRKFDYFYKIIF
ncbi:hypothetical protein, partial [Absiella sp. AM54-8XD]|uniref:hypothetical protein n=1 Tax=Absiella sp. AM54-8XD TaxID=2292279 RepID=UPI001F47994A